MRKGEASRRWMGRQGPAGALLRTAPLETPLTDRKETR
jgi:hypothetical protein